jgi:hypothetical protein
MVKTPSVPEWVRNDFQALAEGSFPDLAAEVTWLKGLVNQGMEESRAEYVAKAKTLIRNMTARAVIQPALLKRQSVVSGEGA